MTEQQNVEKVKQMYAAFGRGDIQTILNESAEDVIWDEPGTSILPTAGRYQGREGVGKFFANVAQTWDFESFEPQEFIAQGDKVIVLGYYRARARATDR